MKKNVLNDYILSRLKKIEKDLLAYLHDKDPEQLHRLRVEIKRIKAIFSFANSTDTKSYRAAKLKPLFRKAGEIRELQINIQLLSSLPQADEKQIAQLKNEELNLSEEFISKAPLFFKSIKNFRRKTTLSPGLPTEKRIKKYFRKKLAKTLSALQPGDRERLHLFRKGIKEMMYVFDALPDKSRERIIINRPYINRLQQKAGEWHDTAAVISYLSGQTFQGLDQVISKLAEKERDEFNDLIIIIRKLKNEVPL